MICPAVGIGECVGGLLVRIDDIGGVRCDECGRTYKLLDEAKPAQPERSAFGRAK